MEVVIKNTPSLLECKIQIFFHIWYHFIFLFMGYKNNPLILFYLNILPSYHTQNIKKLLYTMHIHIVMSTYINKNKQLLNNSTTYSFWCRHQYKRGFLAITKSTRFSHINVLPRHIIW